MSTSIWQGPLDTPQVLLLLKFKVPLVSKEISVAHSLDFLASTENQKYFFFFNNTMEKNPELRKGISMKDSSISVIFKNIMRENNFFIHSKPCQVHAVIHKYLKWVMNPLTHTLQIKLVSSYAWKNNFKMMKPHMTRWNNPLDMYMVILSHRLLLLCKYWSK